MLASIPPLDQVNALIDFDNHFKISSISISFCQHLGAGTEKGQFAFDYCQKIMMRVGVYFKQEIQSNTYRDQTKRLH